MPCRHWVPARNQCTPHATHAPCPTTSTQEITHNIFLTTSKNFGIHANKKTLRRTTMSGYFCLAQNIFFEGAIFFCSADYFCYLKKIKTSNRIIRI